MGSTLNSKQEIDVLRADMKNLLSQLRTEIDLSNELETRLLSDMQSDEASQTLAEEIHYGGKPLLDIGEIEEKSFAFKTEISPLKSVISQMSGLFSALSAPNSASAVQTMDTEVGAHAKVMNSEDGEGATMICKLQGSVETKNMAVYPADASIETKEDFEFPGGECTEIVMTLDIRFEAIGDLSQFSEVLRADVARASLLEPKKIRIIDVRSGSTIVTVHIAGDEARSSANIASDLERQQIDPASKLRRGVLTSKIVGFEIMSKPKLTVSVPLDELERTTASLLNDMRLLASVSPEEIFSLLAGSLTHSQTAFASFMRSRINCGFEPGASKTVEDEVGNELRDDRKRLEIASLSDAQFISLLLKEGKSLFGCLSPEQMTGVLKRIESFREMMITSVFPLDDSQTRIEGIRLISETTEQIVDEDREGDKCGEIDHFIALGQFLSQLEILTEQGHAIIEILPDIVFGGLSDTISEGNSSLAALLRNKICGSRPHTGYIEHDIESNFNKKNNNGKGGEKLTVEVRVNPVQRIDDGQNETPKMLGLSAGTIFPSASECGFPEKSEALSMEMPLLTDENTRMQLNATLQETNSQQSVAKSTKQEEQNSHESNVADPLSCHREMPNYESMSPRMRELSGNVQSTLHQAVQAVCDILVTSVLDSSVREIDEDTRLNILSEQENFLRTQMQAQLLTTGRDSFQMRIDLLANNSQELLERLPDRWCELLADSVAHGDAEVAMILRSTAASPELLLRPPSCVENDKSEDAARMSLATTRQPHERMVADNWGSIEAEEAKSVKSTLESLLADCQNVLKNLRPDQASIVINQIERSQGPANRKLIETISAGLQSATKESDSQQTENAVVGFHKEDGRGLNQDSKLLQFGQVLTQISPDETFDLIFGALLRGQSEVARFIRSGITSPLHSNADDLHVYEPGVLKKPLICQEDETYQACDSIVELLASGKRLLGSLSKLQLTSVAKEMCSPEGSITSRLARVIFEEKNQSLMSTGALANDNQALQIQENHTGVLQKVNFLLDDARRLFQRLQPMHLVILLEATASSRVGRYLARIMSQARDSDPDTPRNDTSTIDAHPSSAIDGRAESTLVDVSNDFQLQIRSFDKNSTDQQFTSYIVNRIAELLSESEMLISALPTEQARLIIEEIDRCKTPLSQSLVRALANSPSNDDITNLALNSLENPGSADSKAYEKAVHEDSGVDADSDFDQVMQFVLNCGKQFLDLSNEEVFGLIANSLVQSQTELSIFLKAKIARLSDPLSFREPATTATVGNTDDASEFQRRTDTLRTELLSKGEEILEALPSEQSSLIVKKIEEQRSEMAGEILKLISTEQPQANSCCPDAEIKASNRNTDLDYNDEVETELDHLLVRGQYLALSEFLAKQGQELLENVPNEIFDLIAVSITGESSDLAAVLRFKICGGELNRPQALPLASQEESSKKSVLPGVEEDKSREDVASDVEENLQLLFGKCGRLLDSLPEDRMEDLVGLLARPKSPLAASIKQILATVDSEERSEEGGCGQEKANNITQEAENNLVEQDSSPDEQDCAVQLEQLINEGRLLLSAISQERGEEILSVFRDSLKTNGISNLSIASVVAAQANYEVGSARESDAEVQHPRSTSPSPESQDVKIMETLLMEGAKLLHSLHPLHSEALIAGLEEKATSDCLAAILLARSQPDAVLAAADIEDSLDINRQDEVQKALSRAMDIVSAVIATSALDAAIREMDELSRQDQISAAAGRYIDALTEQTKAADQESLQAFLELLVVYGGQLMELAPDESFEQLAGTLSTSTNSLAAVIRAVTPTLSKPTTAGLTDKNTEEAVTAPESAPITRNPLSGDVDSSVLVTLISEGQRLLTSLPSEQADRFLSALRQHKSPLACRVAHSIKRLWSDEEQVENQLLHSSERLQGLDSAPPPDLTLADAEGDAREASAHVEEQRAGDVVDVASALLSRMALDSAVREVDEAALQRSIEETTEGLLSLMRREVEAANLESFRHGLDLLIVHGQWLMERASDPSFTLLSKTIAAGDSEVAALLRSAAASPDALLLSPLAEEEEGGKPCGTERSLSDAGGAAGVSPGAAASPSPDELLGRLIQEGLEMLQMLPAKTADGMIEQATPHPSEEGQRVSVAGLVAGLAAAGQEHENHDSEQALAEETDATDASKAAGEAALAADVVEAEGADATAPLDTETPCPLLGEQKDATLNELVREGLSLLEALQAEPLYGVLQGVEARARARAGGEVSVAQVLAAVAAVPGEQPLSVDPDPASRADEGPQALAGASPAHATQRPLVAGDALDGDGADALHRSSEDPALAGKEQGNEPVPELAVRAAVDAADEKAEDEGGITSRSVLSEVLRAAEGTVGDALYGAIDAADAPSEGGATARSGGNVSDAGANAAAEPDAGATTSRSVLSEARRGRTTTVCWGWAKSRRRRDPAEPKPHRALRTRQRKLATAAR